MMPYWTSAVLFFSARTVPQFVLLRGLKQEKPQFKIYMDSDEKHCRDWVRGKFIFIIRLHSLKLSAHKDDRFLPARRNCCIIVTYDSSEALMHGHHFALCLIHFCVSLGTPNTGELQRLTQRSPAPWELDTSLPRLKKKNNKIKIIKHYVWYYSL